MVNYKELKDKTPDELIALAQKYVSVEDIDNAERILCELLDAVPDHPQGLFILGKIYSKMERKGLANTLFRRALEGAPERSEIWGSIGASIDSYVNPKEAQKFLRKAIQLNPKNEAALVNLSNSLALDGDYEESVKVAERVLEFQPDSIAGHDNYGMSCLALGRWAEGWDGVEWALGHGYRPETQFGEEDRWEGMPDQSVVVYGMQGIGDEILYGSCLPDLIEDSREVIVECDPRLEGLFRRSFPEASVYGTRKMAAEWPNHHTWDARVAIDTLPRFYRREWADFPGKPFLEADPDRRLQWRALLDCVSSRPKIGVAWTGGGKLTARNRRSIDVELLRPLTELGDLVSLEYEPRDHKDMKIHQWDHATLTDNYDDTAALVAELDYVVTVCTAVVHLAGGLGVPCFVLKPEKPSWRYNPESMPWYDSVELIKFNESWANSIAEVKTRLEQKQEKAA